MKKFTLILLLCTVTITALGQSANLVPNPSFEDTVGTTCPSGLNQMGKVKHWFQFPGGNCDYYNMCGSGLGGVPSNYSGYQHAANGSAYIGMVAYEPAWPNSDYKEPAVVQITPMQTGGKYKVSMSVSLGNKSRHATNDLGSFFYKDGFVSGAVNNTPQVSYSSYGVITDTVNWTRLTGYMTADSAYEYMVIGGFTPYSTLNPVKVNGGSGTIGAAYYLIDSVEVVLMDTLFVNTNISSLCNPDTVEIPYVVTSVSSFSSNNIFTLQLSDSSGSFANPYNIAVDTSDTSDTFNAVFPNNLTGGSSYRLRIIASSPFYTSAVYGDIAIGVTIPSKPVASSNSPVCYDGILNLSALSSTSGVNYSWTGPRFYSTDQSPSVNNVNAADSGEYIVTATLFGCSSMDTISVNIYEGFDILQTSPSGTICNGDTLMLDVITDTTSGLTYSWSGPNSFSDTSKNPFLPNVNYNNEGSYIVTVSDGNCIKKDTAIIDVVPIPVFSGVSNSPVCVGSQVELGMDSNYTSVSYSWSGPNNFTSTSKSPVVYNATISDAGDYVINVSRGGGCTYSDTVTVVIDTTKSFTAIGSSPVCEGDSIQLGVDTAFAGAIYSWSGPGNFSATSKDPKILNVTLARDGDYIVDVVNGGCTVKDTVTIEVRPAPVFTGIVNSPLCEGNTIQFSVSSNFINGVSYTWSGPNSFSSSVPYASINNAAQTHAGSYYATATRLGCKYYDTVEVVVNPVPDTPTLTNNTPFCEPDSLLLTATTTTGGVTYSWSGPNGFSSTDSTIHMPEAADTLSGIYTATVTLNGCSSSDTTLVVVKTSPDTVALSNNSPVCEGGIVYLNSDTSTTGVSYTWTGPGNYTAVTRNAAIPNTTYNKSGWYKMTVDLNGCLYMDSTYVDIKEVPQLTVSNNAPVCEKDTLELLANTSTSNVTYSWSGPNSFSSADSVILFPASTTGMSGAYKVVADKNGCSDSATMNVLVKPLPDSVTLSTNSPICEADTLYLNSDSSTAGVIYSWSGPLSFSANTRSVTEPNTAPNMSGWYAMTVNLNGCTFKDSILVNIYAVPATPAVTYDTVLCVGETLNLTATSLTGATYTWTGPNNFNSNQQNPVKTNVTFSDTGTYTVTAVNNICSSPQASVNVSINPQPFVVIFSNKDSLCAGEQVIFTALPNNTGGTPTYQWYVNAQAVGTGTTYTSTGINHNDIIRVDMTEYTKCSQSFTDPSNDIQMTVLPWLVPSVTITSDKTGPIKPYHYITFTATAVNAGNSPEYQWKRNGTDVLGAKSSQWSANTLNDNDSISVEIESSYRCPQPKDAVSNGIIVRILTSVGEIDDLSGLTLYPNPNSGLFTLEANGLNAQQVQVEVINVVGQSIYKDTAYPDNKLLKTDIRLGEAVPGVYLLKLNADGKKHTIRFVIK